MKFKNEQEFTSRKLKNTDPYGACIFKFAENWAARMEKAIVDGQALKDVAEATSRQADDDCGGITGYMYGAAVSILSTYWEHGEDLRKWHNKEYEYVGDGVVNPAILTIER